MTTLSPYIHQLITHEDSFNLYSRITSGIDCFLLDSSKKESPLSQYTIFGTNPFLSIKYHNGIIYSKDYSSTSAEFIIVETELSIFDYLNSILSQYSLHNPTTLPFIGGAIGYFGYDLSKELERIDTTTTLSVDIPDSYFVFYDNCIIHDLKNHILTITGIGQLTDSKQSVETLLQLINQTEKPNQKNDITLEEGPAKTNSIFHSTFSKATYMDAIESMRDYIEQGHIYISNMTHTFSSSFHKTPYDTYHRLRRINPAPFSAYLPCDEFHILSSSPERFLEIREGLVQTRPIKGTVPRGKTPEEDETNRLRLEASEKDKSELLMIVDLERNDLSRVCCPGSVKVTEIFKTEQYATVYHLVSTIEGQLRQDLTAIDCIKATFPGGSITGAPKVRAMEIIDELEHNNRGIYTGSIGYLGFDGNADFNIVIRTIIMKDNMAYIGVGGGITWESDPESEYQETIDKAVALFKALDATYEDI